MNSPQFPPNKNTLKAIRRLGSFTCGRFDIWALAGSHLAASRAIVLSDLQGYRVPQSKAGVNALRSALYQALGIIGECEAEREENFRFVCKELTGCAKPELTDFDSLEKQMDGDL